MKIDRYRDLMNNIDTDLSCDDKIKNELRLCGVLEKDEQRNSLLKGKPVIKERPIFTVLHKFSITGRLLTSIAFLAIPVILLISVHIHLRSTARENSGLSASSITQELEENQYEDIMKDDTENAVEDTAEDIVMDDIEDTAESSAEDPADMSEAEEDTSVTAADDEADSNEELDSVEEEESLVKDSSEQTDANKTGIEVKAEDFYFAYLDTIYNSGVKTAIPNLIVRFHGTIDSINPDDFTDIVLTRDGVPIDNGIILTNEMNQMVWGYEDITDFYFKFAANNTEPGNYGLTGKYKGVPFNIYDQIIEAGITKEAAYSEDLKWVSLGGYVDEDGRWIRLSEMMFAFNGLQNSFYVSDISDLKITCNDKEIPYAFDSEVFRYYDWSYNGAADTTFNLVLTDKLTNPGVYVITGKYQGVPFISSEFEIP